MSRTVDTADQVARGMPSTKEQISSKSYLKEKTQIPTEQNKKPKTGQGTDMNSTILTSSHCKLLANFNEMVQPDRKTQHDTKKITLHLCLLIYEVWQKSNATDFLLTMKFILFTKQG
jgi:hypothetical protein